MTAATADGAVFAWDGGRHLAFALEGGAAALFAHTNAGQELTALWEAEAGACAVRLPEGCRHAELHLLAGGMPAGTIAVELDDLLLPDLIAPGLAGLSTVGVSTGDDLALAADAPGDAASLNLAQGGVDGFARRRVGPLFDPAGPGRRVAVAASAAGDGVALRFSAGGERLLAAQIFGDAPGAFEGVDASGATPDVAVARGFRLLAPEGGTLTLAPFGEPDEILVLAPRGHLAAWGAEGQGGSRLSIAKDGDGWRTRAVAGAYRPASSTALAALGGGGALTAGGAAQAGAADTAADLAAAIWQRAKGKTPAPTDGRLAAAAEKSADGLPPLARLTRLGTDAAEGLSPVVAALGPAHGVSAPAQEEIDAQPAPERLALALWFAADAELARQALAARVLLPPPGAAPASDRIRAALAWYGEGELRVRLERGLARAATPEDQRALRQAAEAVGESWIDLSAVLAAEAALRRHPEPAEAGGPVHALIAKLRLDAAEAAAAQAEARGLDLGRLAEWRSGLAAAAAEANQPESFAADLAKRHSELGASDIVLLHRHFAAALGRQRGVEAVRAAVEALDAAAGNGGLAARIDRTGDPLVGMTRLGSTSEAAVRELSRLPAARGALVALTGWIDRRAPETADPFLGQLRRNLQGYGCLLLMQAVGAECAAALGEGAADPAAAWRERLRSGLVETLPHYARAALAGMPEEAGLGLSLTGRLPEAS